MKLRYDRLHTEVARDGVSRAVEEWHERERLLRELAYNERDVLLDQELEQAGLTLEEENELQELNSRIQFEEDDIGILRDSLAEANDILICATKPEKREHSKRN
jgi:hypothetical protein